MKGEPMNKISIGAVSALVLGLVAPALAHHSAKMFDSEHPITLEGTIVEFQWTNPHTWIQVNVPNAQGEMEEWSIEGTSPNNLARRGWTRTTFQPGDKVKMVVNPMKNGSPGGLFVSATFDDGRVVGRQAGGNN
jgi:hypothetical protein